MEFDKSRVYTALNADELKVGSKVICAFSISELKKRVDEGEHITEVYQILSDGLEHRIDVYSGESYLSYPFAYLVSEPEEKKLKWTDLKLGDKVRNKACPTVSFLVTGYDGNPSKERHVYIRGCWRSNEELAEWEKVEE